MVATVLPCHAGVGGLEPVTRVMRDPGWSGWGGAVVERPVQTRPPNSMAITTRAAVNGQVSCPLFG
jgi:hypothetical protein